MKMIKGINEWIIKKNERMNEKVSKWINEQIHVDKTMFKVKLKINK